MNEETIVGTFNELVDTVVARANEQDHAIAQMQDDIRMMRKRHVAYLPGAVKKDVPPLSEITDDEWREEKYLRGFLLAGSPDRHYQQMGLSLMEEASPGRFEKYHRDCRERRR
jgi:hypothetical protein